MSTTIKVYFTHHFLREVNQSKDSSQLKKNLIFHLLPQLRRYPARGRLLLNRDMPTSEIRRLNEQLCQQLTMGELRECCFSQCVMVYLLRNDALFLLSCVELTPAFAGLWEESGTL